MQIIETIPNMRSVVAAERRDHRRIALVPTMGNLHDGHLSLVHKAREVCDRVVVSIYVNPMQFVVGEDLSNYPRTLDADCEKLHRAGVDWVFTPSDQGLYPEGKDRTTYIDVPELDSILEGRIRPGHFRGVATVVNKLFNIVRADVAIFGEKDFQQLRLIRRMVADLNLPVEVLGMPTARDADGLALSSRNGYLSASEREQAGELFQTITAMREKILAGETDFSRLSAQARDDLQAHGFSPDYVEIRRSDDLQLPGNPSDDLVILAAARLGSTRLLDNLRV